MSTPKQNKQAHNLSPQDLRDLQDKQIGGEEIETVDGNVDSNYKVPVHEQHLVHATIEAKSFDSQSGAKLSKPLTQKFYPKDFDRMEEANAFKGKDVTILHDPERDGSGRQSKMKVNNALDVNSQDSSKKEADAPKLTPAQQKKADAENLKTAQAKYKELYSEDAPADATQADLDEAIQSKLDEIEAAKNDK